MKKFIFLGLLLGVGLAVTLFATQVFAGRGDDNPKINVCHATGSENHPYSAIRVDDDGYLNGHPDDFLYTGPTKDGGKIDNKEGQADDWCNENAPKEDVYGCTDPEATNYNPEATKDDESCEYKQDEPKDYCDTLPGVQAEDEDCPVTTPTPTPTEQPKVEEHHDSPSQPSAPTCGDSTPGSVANIYVDAGVKNDGKLEVRWLPGEPKGNKAHIRYSEVNGEWRYSLLNTDNDGVEEIGGLQNGVHYWFQVAQVNGCAVGPWSNSFDPTP